MATRESQREPCPDRIIAGAFSMSAFHFVKGFYNSPTGVRLSGGAQSVRMNAPQLGGNFVRAGMFSAIDCALVYARKKEDPWNSILSAAATGGLLSARQGLGVAARSAANGAMLCAFLEGVGIVLNKYARAHQQNEPMGLPSQVFGQYIPETSSAGSRSWFGSLFGNGKKKASDDNSGSKTQILESFDAPPVPTYEF